MGASLSQSVDSLQLEFEARRVGVEVPRCGRSAPLEIVMGCGDFQQVRLGEMITFAFDTNGDIIDNALGLESAIDLGGANVVAVTITPCSIDLQGGVSFDFNLMTAPINNSNFYASALSSGSSAVMSFTTTATKFLSVEKLSRFFMIAPTINTPPSAEATFVCTIDVIVRN